MPEPNPWTEVCEFILKESLRALQEIYDQFNVKFQQWLDEILAEPIRDDWHGSIEQFVAEVEEMGLEILPDSLRRLEEIVESRIAGTHEFSHLGPAKRAVSQATERPPYIVSVVPDVSGPPGAPSGGGKSNPPPSTAPEADGGGKVPAAKPRGLADRRGEWIEGTKGDGVFQYADNPENRKAGLANKKVRFKGGYIGLGGLPPEAYYGGSAEAASVEVSTVKGTSADNAVADEAMRKKLNDPNWKRPAGYIWNHAGEPGSKTLELVDQKLHERIAHAGAAAALRAMAVVNVYLTLKDALQAAGIIQPDYFEYAREEYYFVADDGSVFTVQPGWLWGGTRVFIAGPRKGQTESISGEEVEKHRKDAEEQWGRYIPSSWFREPRFIPGKQRKTLPLYEEMDGVPYESGWIDESGVHKDPRARPWA